MTHRQRAMAALRGETVDRIPFIGRMELWFNYARNRGELPERYAGGTLWDLQRDLDIGIFAMGAWSGSFFTARHRRVVARSEQRDGLETTTYETPFGDLRSVKRKSEQLADADVTGLEIEHLFKSPADYDALAFLIDDLQIVDNYDDYGKLVAEVGADGLALPFCGKVAMHQLMENYLGYETFYYELHDHRDQVERLHDLLRAKQLEVLALAGDSPAEAIELGGNYDEFLTPPGVYQEYIQPLYREARRIVPSDMPIVVHGDGEMRQLLDLLADSDIDCVEALTPKPMTTIDLADLRRRWADKVTLWGGIASVVLCPPFTQEAFEAHMDTLFASVAPGDRFILGFGDNVPTDGSFDRVAQIARYVRDYGALPWTDEPFAAAR